MPDDFKRAEQTHIDEVARTATSTVQWFLEKANAAGTHPITHNNKLALFMGGQEGFADIAERIKAAKESIDLCCWGFDPGMELVRKDGWFWPRGETYGDLLIDAGRRGVKVRLLVWFDPTLDKIRGHPPSMPGYTNGTFPWRADGGWCRDYVKKLNAKHSLNMVKKYYSDPMSLAIFTRAPYAAVKRMLNGPNPELISMLAREEYCNSWYQSAFLNDIKNVEIRTRSGSSSAVAESLDMVDCDLDFIGLERTGLVHVATHHQKPILIDFFHKEGAAAVGYVMGLNSVTDYWDSNHHMIEDPRRECGGEKEQEECVQAQKDTPGEFTRLKPYHDYACRIEGRALVSLYNNFVKGWEHAGPERKRDEASEVGSRGMPTALLRKPEPGDSSVQIVRTQPDEKDTTIRDISYQALDVATLAARYLYIENQYFQDSDWAKRLMKKRAAVVAAWRAGCAKAGKTMRQMPIMHVFIVIPVPERKGMIPRTYDTLAHLGQQDAMTGQVKEINEANGPKAVNITGAWRDILRRANAIEKPDPITLEERFGLKILTAMLNTCDFHDGRWRYREIYVHSKLTIVDDVFLMLGSANLNLRSMAVDSEINVATNDATHARAFRQRIWKQHSGGFQKTSGGFEKCDGGDGSAASISAAMISWRKLMYANEAKVVDKATSANARKLDGYLLPLKDERKSMVLLG